MVAVALVVSPGWSDILRGFANGGVRKAVRFLLIRTRLDATKVLFNEDFQLLSARWKMHAFDGNLARFGPASDCIARNRDTNDVSLTPVLIAAKKFGPMNTNGQNPE